MRKMITEFINWNLGKKKIDCEGFWGYLEDGKPGTVPTCNTRAIWKV